MANETSQLKLIPEAVRLRASSIPGCIEVAQPATAVPLEHVCTFLVGCHGEGGTHKTLAVAGERKIEDLARITVYCDTGTVATARVLAGSVRHTFRKNVTSLDVLERSLRYPAELPVIDWHLVGLADGSNPTVNHPSTSVSKNLELIDVGMAILRGEREKLVQHGKALESAVIKKEAGTSSTAKRQDAVSTSMEFQFSLAAGPMKHVDQCLNDINKMGKLVRGVATNGTGTVFLYGNGGVAYTPNIPRALYHRLSQLRNSKLHSSRPAYVALGTRERYFVAFHDGTFSYKGPKGLDRELRKLTKPPLSVAFGSNYDAFFIVFHDGFWKFQGRGIPGELEERLATRKEPTKLACVNIGPSGEWFLRSQDGRVGWGGVSDEMDEAIQSLLDDGHFLNFLDFGENGSYFVSYD
jgi:hypothetical protein